MSQFSELDVRLQSIKSKRGVIKRYNAIVRKLYMDHKGGSQYGFDMPTLSIIDIPAYTEIIELKKLYKTLPV